ncbi:hypothetical protein F52700_5095 [Fusarium sp. NRRL 52700]|nr:hypothetical protein F52700_5095 [Fusarium sp. NRRL 52700]
MARQPPIRPEQGSYGQFQLPTSQPKTPHSRSKEVLAKLGESIPRLKLSGNMPAIFTITAQQNIGDSTELMIQRYMSAVRAMVQAMERVCILGSRHRVYEGALLYSRISLSSLTQYTNVTRYFESCFPTFSCIYPEIQASLPLAPTFILKYRHPPYRFGDICAGLSTEVLDEDDYARFVSVLESGRPVPTVLSLPANAPYPALSAIEHQPESGRDVQKVSSNTFALLTNFPLVYKVLSVSVACQQLLQEVTHRITYENLREVPHTPLFELQWIGDYDITADQIVGDMVH